MRCKYSKNDRHYNGQQKKGKTRQTIIYKRLHINRFSPPHSCALPKVRTWISNVLCRGLFCVQWVKITGDCSLCRYWWNWWPSLFKLSIQNRTLRLRYTNPIKHWGWTRISIYMYYNHDDKEIKLSYFN